MLECFIYSLSAVAPILFMILLGNILSRKMLSRSFFDQCDKLVFRVALPVYVFSKLADADISQLPEMSAIIFCMVAISVTFLLVSLGAYFFLPLEKRGSFVHGTFRANFSIIGFVLAETMLDESGATAIACATPFIIILSNILATATLTINMPREKRMSFGKLVLNIIKNISTNPLILSILVALPFMIFDIKLPEIATDSLDFLKNIATPLALLSLGAVSPSEEKMKIMPEAVVATVIKLIVMPAAFILIAYALGLRGNSIALVMVLGTSPTAVTSYIMSKSMHSDAELARQIVLFTTVCCSFTIFVFAFILRYLQII